MTFCTPAEDKRATASCPPTEVLAQQLHLPCGSCSCTLGSAGLPGAASCVVSALLLPSWPLQRMGYGMTGQPEEPATLVLLVVREAPAVMGQV